MQHLSNIMAVLLVSLRDHEEEDELLLAEFKISWHKTSYVQGPRKANFLNFLLLIEWFYRTRRCYKNVSSFKFQNMGPNNTTY